MLADNIRALRKSLHLSQSEFARLLYVTQGAVSQWEKGLTRPSSDQLTSIAATFSVSIDSLLGDDIVVAAQSSALTDDPLADAVRDAFHTADPVTRGIICDILHVPRPQTKTNTVTA